MSYNTEPFSDFLVRSMRLAKMTNQQLADKFGISSQAVSQWRSGKNMPKSSVIDAVRSYLAEATGGLSKSSHMGNPKPNQCNGSYGMVNIPEYNVQAAAGAGLEVPDLQDASKVWTLPRSALDGIRVTAFNNLAIISVSGDSMIPDYLPGEKILVDRGDCVVSHDGAYVIYNNYGLVVKMIQVIPGIKSDQDVLRIISKNPDYPPYERLVSEVSVHGRVVGKWVWK